MPGPKPYHVPLELLDDGALRQFVDYATGSAVSPQPFLALGEAICLVRVVAGRRYRTPTDLRSDLYAIGIGDSGGGKDQTRRCVSARSRRRPRPLSRRRGPRLLRRAAHCAQRHPARLFQVDQFGQS